MTHRALITGIGGQDGSLLAEQLLGDGYEVVGVGRPGASYPNLAGIRDRIALLTVDLLDQQAVEHALREVSPNEVYNFASPSFVPSSWSDPTATVAVGTIGLTALLESIRVVDGDIRLCQASSSEIFGDPLDVPQTETTPLAPDTPYGAVKAFGHRMISVYRSRHGLHASSAILYNHESPRRSPEFLPRKVSLAVARIKAGLQRDLVLGDLDAKRDWGYAGDYVRAMRAMTRAAEPADYVIASGRLHTVRALVTLAFAHAGLEAEEHIRIDEALFRPQRMHDLVGDPSRAFAELDWSPTVEFDELVRTIVDTDVEQLTAAAR